MKQLCLHYSYHHPLASRTLEQLRWSGPMLLEKALRPITHFPVPAKELSDSGSCSHGSDLKLWPQRNATCPTSHDTELSASLYGVRQLRFGCQSCCLHWAKKSYSLSGSWGLSHSIFPAQRRLAVLKRSNPTELPRENFSPTIHPCWLLIAWKSRWVSNRGTILTDNCTWTGSVEQDTENAKMGRGVANQQRLTYGKGSGQSVRQGKGYQSFFMLTDLTQ